MIYIFVLRLKGKYGKMYFPFAHPHPSSTKPHAAKLSIRLRLMAVVDSRTVLLIRGSHPEKDQKINIWCPFLAQK